MDLKDRKILITGANGGLGRAMAVSWPNTAPCLPLRTNTRACRGCQSRPAGALRAQAHAFAADLTDADAVAAMVSDSAATLQGMDGLVNNAAILTDDDTDPVATSLDSWRATLEVNVTGAFLMCKNVLPLFLSQSAAPLSRFLPLWQQRVCNTQIAYTTNKARWNHDARCRGLCARQYSRKLRRSRSCSYRPHSASFRHARKMADAATPYSDGTAGPAGRNCRAGVFFAERQSRLANGRRLPRRWRH